MISENTRLSIIMACFNASGFIKESIQSILEQSYTDFELIIIDDCSTDNSLDIVKHFETKDNRISVIALTKNSGPAVARNAGIKIAKGDWVGILDSDDIAQSLRFEKQMKLADSNEELVLIASNSITIDKSGKILNYNKYPTNHKNLLHCLRRFKAFPPHSSMLYNKKLFLKTGEFNTKFVPSEDFDLWLRLANSGKIASVNNYLVKIRKYDNNISNANGGLLQMQMAIAASVCNNLRVSNFPDPSADDDLWSKFNYWLNEKIEEDGYFIRRNEWKKIRSLFFNKKNKMAGTFFFLYNLFLSKYSFPLIREKIFGSSLPKRFAKEWIKLHSH